MHACKRHHTQQATHHLGHLGPGGVALLCGVVYGVVADEGQPSDQ